MRLRIFTTALVIAGFVALAPPPSHAATNFSILGRGWGHGLGMSQWGAKGLADKGWTTAQILKHFYRGTAIGTSTAVKTVRVGLTYEQSAITMAGNGRFDIYDNTGKLRASGASGQTWKVQPSSSQLVVYNSSGAKVFSSPAPVTVRWEPYGTLLKLPQTGYSYKHGRIDFDINASSGKARAILIIPLEQYLYGLGEMPSSWDADALKAQAIAGRTYAVEKILRLGQNRATCNCGVYASTLDQAYVGVAQEVASWTGAVNATVNQVATYNSKPIQAYYSASDGGYTENNENVWGGSAIAYLRGVCDPGDYANGANPRSNWTFTIDGDEMGQRLLGGGYTVGSVTKISAPNPRGVSGRVLRVIDATRGGWAVTGTTGSARIGGGTFQSLLGMYSTFVMYHVTGPIRLRYDALNCAPGWPVKNQFAWKDVAGTTRGTAQNFANQSGRMFLVSSTGKVWWVWGPILKKYDALRANKIDLGMPTSDVFSISGGKKTTFEHGYIIWNTSTNAVSYRRT
jgi:SpoIID/LytB domain protein